MPTFNDKSVQGIIDIIHAELTCFGTISDKSIKAIINAADAQGITITDHSVQGIIDALASASCVPPLEPLSALLKFVWSPITANTIMAVARPLSEGYVPILMRNIVGYGWNDFGISGEITSTPGTSGYGLALVSMKITNDAETVTYTQINAPLAGGVMMSTLTNGVWNDYTSTKLLGNYGYGGWDHISFDPAGHWYAAHPAVYDLSYMGNAHISINTLVREMSSGTWHYHPHQVLSSSPSGSTCKAIVRCGAIPMSGQAMNITDYLGRDLFMETSAGIDERTYTMDIYDMDAGARPSATIAQANTLWGGFYAPS